MVGPMNKPTTALPNPLSNNEKMYIDEVSFGNSTLESVLKAIQDASAKPTNPVIYANATSPLEHILSDSFLLDENMELDLSVLNDYKKSIPNNHRLYTKQRERDFERNISTGFHTKLNYGIEHKAAISGSLTKPDFMKQDLVLPNLVLPKHPDQIISQDFRHMARQREKVLDAYFYGRSANMV